MKTTTKELTKLVYNEISNDCLDNDIIRIWNWEVEWEIQDLTRNIIEAILDYTCSPDKDWNIELDDNSDFRNDKNSDWRYFCDLTSEWADSQVDIYYHSLRKNAYAFKSYTEDAVSNVGVPDIAKDGIEKLFMYWEYEFYNQLANWVLNTLSDIVKNNNEDTEE